VFLVFLIDSLIFPTLPELFTVIAFIYDPSLLWGVAILLVIIAGEFIGMTTLYLVVEHIRVPKRVQVIATRYINFLIMGDERLLLVNRVAPMIPFCGAFVSIMEDWTYHRALLFLISGAVLKYGLILLASGFFYALFSGPQAQVITLSFVAVMIVVSFIYGYFRQRKMKKGEACP
jgi:hypothetical protein